MHFCILSGLLSVPQVWKHIEKANSEETMYSQNRRRTVDQQPTSLDSSVVDPRGLNQLSGFAETRVEHVTLGAQERVDACGDLMYRTIGYEDKYQEKMCRAIRDRS